MARRGELILIASRDFTSIADSLSRDNNLPAYYYHVWFVFVLAGQALAVLFFDRRRFGRFSVASAGAGIGIGSRRCKAPLACRARSSSLALRRV